MGEEYSVKKGNKNPLPKMESRGDFIYIVSGLVEPLNIRKILTVW